MELSLGQMVDFHQTIGAERIQARLHYLKQYWARQVEDEKKIRFTASLDPRLSCAALGFDIPGKKWVDISKALRENGRFESAAHGSTANMASQKRGEKSSSSIPRFLPGPLSWIATSRNSGELLRDKDNWSLADLLSV
jgi:selenocysteine lyase/cysteine desulfurase